MSNDVSDWWSTNIIDMAPGHIAIRGHRIEDLIGRVSFADMIWLMTSGTLPDAASAALLEAALVAAVDHGPQAPSIATARMAVTCGLGIHGAMASAVNMLDDVHGGAGEQAVELFGWIVEDGMAPTEAVDRWQSDRSQFVPGFGHRFHKPVDPRAPRLLALVDQTAHAGHVTGQSALAARDRGGVAAPQR